MKVERGQVWEREDGGSYVVTKVTQQAAFLVMGDANKTKLHSPMPMPFDELYRDYTYTGKRNPL